MTEPRGTLITFEGVEGSGKSTQIKLLAERLMELGHDVLVSREPGATALGRELRRLLLDPQRRPDALTELLLYLADRRQHCHQVLEPALRAGKLVLVDRFVDSTWVYQGFAADCGRLEIIEELNRLVVNGLWPELTLLLDCPASAGLERARRRNRETGDTGVADHFEQLELDFHEKVRRGFLALAAREEKRFRVIDAAFDPAQVHGLVWKAVTDFYALG